MTRTLFLWLAAGAIAATTAWTGMLLWKHPTQEDRPPVVFVCRETGALFLTRDPAVPQVHPDTDRATLWPGLYCPDCERWTAAPPMDKVYGKPDMLHCPKCRTPRVLDGEWPDEIQEL